MTASKRDVIVMISTALFGRSYVSGNSRKKILGFSVCAQVLGLREVQALAVERLGAQLKQSR